MVSQVESYVGFLMVYSTQQGHKADKPPLKTVINLHTFANRTSFMMLTMLMASTTLTILIIFKKFMIKLFQLIMTLMTLTMLLILTTLTMVMMLTMLTILTMLMTDEIETLIFVLLFSIFCGI